MLYSWDMPCGHIWGGGSVNVFSVSFTPPRRLRLPSLLLIQTASTSETFFHAAMRWSTPRVIVASLASLFLRGCSFHHCGLLGVLARTARRPFTNNWRKYHRSALTAGRSTVQIGPCPRRQPAILRPPLRTTFSPGRAA